MFKTFVNYLERVDPGGGAFFFVIYFSSILFVVLISIENEKLDFVDVFFISRGDFEAIEQSGPSELLGDFADKVGDVALLFQPLGFEDEHQRQSRLDALQKVRPRHLQRAVGNVPANTFTHNVANAINQSPCCRRRR